MPSVIVTTEGEDEEKEQQAPKKADPMGIFGKWWFWVAFAVVVLLLSVGNYYLVKNKG